jgi:hypothetical protein
MKDLQKRKKVQDWKLMRENKNSNPEMTTVGDCFPVIARSFRPWQSHLGKARLLRFTRNDISLSLALVKKQGGFQYI